MINSGMFRQVLLLSSAQALFQTVSVLVMTIGGLAGAQLAPSLEWSTAPIATMFLGTTIATVPASMFMARVGRRTGFMLGAGLGTMGGLLGAFGIATGSLLLLCLGTLLVGGYQGFAQFYRFAASEVSSDAFNSRAISLVLAGGVVAALLGPMLGRLGGPLLESAYLGSFLILSALSLVAAGLLLGLRVPPSPAATLTDAVARPLLTVMA